MSLAQEQSPQDLLEVQQLLDFEQPMLLVLSRDLWVSHRGMRVLLVEKRRGSWLVLPQSDYYFVQQLRTPTSMAGFVQQNQWLPEPFLRTVVLYMYARGFLEVNGSSIWEPPARPRVPPMVRLVDVRMEDETRARTCGILSRTLSRLIDEDPRPLEVSLRGVSDVVLEPLQVVLEAARAHADRRDVPLRIALWRDASSVSPSLLALATRTAAQLNLGTGHGTAFPDLAESMQGLEAPYRVLLPWSERDRFFDALKAGVPCIGFTFGEKARVGPAAGDVADALLALVDRVMECDLPPFVWSDVTPILTRLMQFPWQVGATECNGYHGAGLVADAAGRCYPCETVRERKKGGRGRLDGRGALHKLAAGALHDVPASTRDPWWRTFYQPCPFIAESLLGHPGPDPRGQLFARLVEGLIWRTMEHSNRLLAQFGVAPPMPPTPPQSENLEA